MATLNTIARPYAKAVFSVAKERSQLQGWGQILRVLQLTLQDPSVQPLLSMPAFAASDWQRFLMSICEGAFPSFIKSESDFLANFLALLLESDRLEALVEVATIYHQLHLQEQGIVEVDVVSAYPLEDDDIARFHSLLKKHFQATIEIKFSIDPTLIGGALFRSGDWVMDGSTKRKLTRLSDGLSRVGQV